MTARPSYARVKTALMALRARGVDLRIICAGSALLERYGRVVDVIRADGFEIAAELWTTHEGANLVTSAQETGVLSAALPGLLRSLSPTAVLVLADRHEVLGAAQAAAYLHLPLVHVQGGERTGSIDDKARDAITQLSDVHCVATHRARWRVYGLTGSQRIYVTGCPSLDLARGAQDEPPVTAEELGGSGPRMDLNAPFLVVLQHPVTNEMAAAGQQMQATLEAVAQVSMPRLVFWPGEDAGADEMSKAIRVWREAHPALSMHTVRNLSPSRFLRLLAQAAVLVGNSSVGIREGSFLGVPVVNIGSRQQGRERAGNVVDASYDADAIRTGIHSQIAHGPYASSSLYGDGHAGERIAEVLTS